MTYEEVAEACTICRRERTLRGSIYDGSNVPVNLADGQVIDRLFNPYALGRTPERMGFAVRVSGYWSGSRRKSLRIANAVYARISRLTIYSARGFRIAAQKSAERASLAPV
jgi:hypothetical protein